MLAPTTLLLAHHGTAGAMRAEALAFSLAVPATTTLVHLLVVPDFWDGMQGDDWLNNASTRDDFARHLERQLATENAAVVESLKAHCKERGLACRTHVAYGDPATRLLDLARETHSDLVVIGPPRRKGETGYRSRMDMETLVRGLGCPLLVAR
jgi:nucleotide-binding universal stress UspA family protein